MALDFLSGGGMGGIGSFASGIGGLLNAFGLGKPKGNYGPTPSEGQANSLFQALLDPNNSLVKQNSDINMQKGMQDMLMQLRLMQMQGARAQGRGMNNPFFNPERMDENFNFMLTRGQPAIAETARNTAKTDIYNTASALKGFVPGEQQRINDQNFNRQNDYSAFQTKGGYGQVSGGLEELLRALMPQQQRSYSPQSYGPYSAMPWQTTGNVNPSGGYY